MWRSPLPRRALVALLALALPACRCSEGTTGVEGGFQVQEQSLDFGRVLEGDTVERPLTLVATGRQDTTVSARTAAPFAAAAAIEVPSGSNAVLSVRFTARNGPETSTLTLDSGTAAFTVALRGVGVRPPICQPSSPCATSRYVLEEDRCVETAKPDGTSCDPGSECLEDGRCQAGTCKGVARRCDDNDLCTDDACAPGQGCVHLARQCPPPTAACRVATCSPASGCGEEVAGDFTLCGPSDCTAAQVCFGGSCIRSTQTDGFPCGAPTPCSAAPTCMAQQCVRPPAGPLPVMFSVPLPSPPPQREGALRTANGNVFAVLCAPPDAGADAGGPSDAGDGGGAEECALRSWTSSGFERFTAPTTDGGARTLLAVSGPVAFTASPSELFLQRTANGAALQSVAAQVQLGQLAVDRSHRGLWLSPIDGGAQLLELGDGGVRVRAERLPVPADDAQLALDARGALRFVRAGVSALVAVEPDGGVRALPVPDAGAGLVVAQGRVVLGGEQVLEALEDGGLALRAQLSQRIDAGAGAVADPRSVMVGGGAVVALLRECEVLPMSCLPQDTVLRLRAFTLDGAPLWSVTVLPTGDLGRVEDLALLELEPGALAALTANAPSDAGSSVALELYAEGVRVQRCRVTGALEVQGAAFSESSLFAVVRRSDGWRLEGYLLTGLTFVPNAWSRPDGRGGTRREEP